jgi:hypothetical protein
MGAFLSGPGPTTRAAVKKSYSPFGRKYGPTSSPSSVSSPVTQQQQRQQQQPPSSVPFGASVMSSSTSFTSMEDQQQEELYFGEVPFQLEEGGSGGDGGGGGGDAIPYSSMPTAPSVPYGKKSYSPFGGSSKPRGRDGGGGSGMGGWRPWFWFEFYITVKGKDDTIVSKPPTNQTMHSPPPKLS